MPKQRVAQYVIPKFHCHRLPGFMDKLFCPRILVKKTTGELEISESQKPVQQNISSHKIKSSELSQ